MQRSGPGQTCRRPAALGNGTVIRVTSTADESIALTFSANDKTQQFTIAAHGSTEFGWLEGFQLADNSTYTISGEKYISRSFSVKDTERCPTD